MKTKNLLLSIISALIFLLCLAQETQSDPPKPPQIELQFGLQLEYPSLRFIGKLQNNTVPVFRTSSIGYNDSPIACRRLDGNPIKNTGGKDLVMVICADAAGGGVHDPIQFYAGDAAWLDQAIIMTSMDLTNAKIQDGFLEIASQLSH